MAKLVVLSQGITGQAYELKAEKTTIGRVDGNSFPVAHASVSGHHCELLLRGEEVWVKDLNSRNGTFINNRQITGEEVLKVGQILRLGQVEFRLEAGGVAPLTSRPQEHSSISPAKTGAGKSNTWIIVIGVILLIAVIGGFIWFFTSGQGHH